MNGKTRLCLIAGVALLAATEGVAAQGAATAPATTATAVAKARAAARANAATPQGREWKQRNSTAAGAPLIPVLNKCLPEDGDEVTAFTIFVRLSQKGRVREVVTDLSAELGACMTTGASELQLPEAPRDDYWVQLNLAAEL
jgi:heterodisulfide reductase subunit A-like polyferredoxin